MTPDEWTDEALAAFQEDLEIEAALAEADAAEWRAMEDAADLRAAQRRSAIETTDSLADLAPLD